MGACSMYWKRIDVSPERMPSVLCPALLARETLGTMVAAKRSVMP